MRPQFNFSREERSRALRVKKLHFLMSAWRGRTTLKAITTGKHSNLKKKKEQQQLRSFEYSMSPGLKQTTQGNILFWMLFEGGKRRTPLGWPWSQWWKQRLRGFQSGRGSVNRHRRVPWGDRANAFRIVLHRDIPLFTPIRLILKQETGTERGSCLGGEGEVRLPGHKRVFQGALHFKGIFPLFNTDPKIAWKRLRHIQAQRWPSLLKRQTLISSRLHANTLPRREERRHNWRALKELQ